MKASVVPGAGLLGLAVLLSGCTAPAATSAPTPSLAVSSTVPEAAARVTDVNCDGVPDLVYATVTRTPADEVPWRAGSVTVRFGGTGTEQTIDQVQLGDPQEEGVGRFGGSLVTGDLNQDGCTDVVVSDSESSNHPVWALWGARDGVSPDRSARLISGEPSLGHALAFVPLPSPVLVVSSDAGPRLYPVQPDGTLGRYQLLTVRSPIDRSPFSVDTFGATVSASGDLLAVGAHEFSDEGYGYPGEVWLVKLLPGLRHIDVRIDQNSRGVPGKYSIGDGFGESVALHGSYLAVGEPFKGHGRVHVFTVTETADAATLSYDRTVVAPPAVPAGTHGFGTTVQVYRPCDDVDGLLIGAGLPLDEPSPVVSVPLHQSSSCSVEVVAGRTANAWTPIGVNRASQDGTAADTAQVVTPGGILTTTGAQSAFMAVTDPARTVLAPPAA